MPIDYRMPVQWLKEIAKNCDEQYGIEADRCADSYFCLGYTLISLHRQETDELKDVLEKKKGAENEQVGESQPEEGESKDGPNSAAKEDISVSSADAQADAQANTNSVPTSAPSTIEVAIKELTKARNIYQRQIDYRDDVHLKLAEVYYHIGLSHSLNNNLQEVEGNIEKAIEVVEVGLVKLKDLHTAEQDADKKEKIGKEISKLEKRLPEMKKGRIEMVRRPVSAVPVSTASFDQSNQPDQRSSPEQRS